jgi:hypothetical protein
MPIYRRLFVLSFLTLLATSFGATRATCTGADPCNACKNCKYCQRCAKDKKTCGTCKRAMERSHAYRLQS